MRIGVDLVNIPRIKDLKERRPDFTNRFFTARENELFERRMGDERVIAGNFALKEAFSKAMGTGITGFNLIDVEVLRDEFGAPTIELYHQAKELFIRKGYREILSSISHDGDYAVGMVVLD